MRSFFTQRMNKVKLNGVTSTWKEMIRGCPQGSSFGPLMWNIFQNDMAYCIKNEDLMMYADEHQISSTGKCISTLEQSLKEVTETALSWYKANLLLVNPCKFQTLIIAPTRQNKSLPIATINLHMNGEVIESTNLLKLLGVSIDEGIDFSHHISHV